MFSIVFIACLGLLVYSNTLLSSFHFDDFTYIVGNNTLKNIWHLQDIWNYYPCRFITFLSLSFNYLLGGLNVIGYHIFNIAVHLASASLVWWLTLLTLSTPVMKKDSITRHANLIALFAGLVFVSHPVQIEAVSYICQRAASMATLFYLASLCLYVKSRLAQDKNTFYVPSLILCTTAMFTKEIAITLPLMILLYEFSFFNAKKDLNWKRVSPFLLTMLIIPLVMLLTQSKFIHEIKDIAQDPKGISPIHYLLTQFRVMITYIRLLFFPFHQHLDYDYPVFKSLFELPVLISILILLTILIWTKTLFAKYRLLSFGIFWFFLALLPESSLLPEKDVIFEHRLYLPLVGFSIFLVSAAYYMIIRHSESKERRILSHIKFLRFAQDDIRLMMIIIFTIIIAFYSFMAYQRNKIWKDEYTLWNDSVSNSPDKARPYMSRGSEFYQQKDFTQAMADYNKAIEINPNYIDVYIDRSDIYFQQGKYDEAIKDLNKIIEIDPKREEAYFNLGRVYTEMGNNAQAIINFTKAIDIKPDRPQSYSNRGESYVKEGNFNQAILDFTKAVDIDPDFAEGYNNRGAVYGRLGQTADALKDLNKAVEISPDFAPAYNNLVALYASQGKSAPLNPNFSQQEYFNQGTDSFKQGNFNTAIADFNAAISISPDSIELYNDRGLAYYNLGQFSQAIADYDNAIGKDPRNADAYYNRGLAYDTQGDQTQAMSDYNKAIELNPNFSKAYIRRGNAYLQENDFDQAISDYNKIIAFDSGYVEAYNNLAICYASQGKLSQALSVADKAIKISPSYGQAYLNRAIIYFKLKKFGKASADVRKAQKLGAAVNPQLISSLQKH